MIARLGAAFCFLAIGLGAFGAHGLKARLTPEMLDVYKTGVLYHLIHALAIWILGLVPAGSSMRLSPSLFAAGILLFSGSLYALALTGARAWGAVTPLGGLCFLAGWAVLIFRR